MLKLRYSSNKLGFNIEKLSRIVNGYLILIGKMRKFNTQIYKFSSF